MFRTYLMKEGGAAFWRAHPEEWYPLGGDEVMASWHARHVRNLLEALLVTDGPMMDGNGNRISSSGLISRLYDQQLPALLARPVATPAELVQVQQLRDRLASLRSVGDRVDADLFSFGIPTGRDGPDHLPIDRLAATEEVISRRQQEADEFAARGGKVMKGIDGSMYCIRTPDDVARAKGEALYEAARIARHAYFGVPYPPPPPQAVVVSTSQAMLFQGMRVSPTGSLGVSNPSTLSNSASPYPTPLLRTLATAGVVVVNCARDMSQTALPMLRERCRDLVSLLQKQANNIPIIDQRPIMSSSALASGSGSDSVTVAATSTAGPGPAGDSTTSVAPIAATVSSASPNATVTVAANAAAAASASVAVAVAAAGTTSNSITQPDPSTRLWQLDVDHLRTLISSLHCLMSQCDEIIQLLESH